jgi:hypothetical protein
MYICGKCDGTFVRFKTPGQCPLCGVWASVKCSTCGHIDTAKVFINNNDCCPKCGAYVSISAGSPSDLSDKAAFSLFLFMILIAVGIGLIKYGIMFGWLMILGPIGYLIYWFKKTKNPLTTISKKQLPGPVLGILWLMTHGVVYFIWSQLYSLFNPTFDKSLYAVADIATDISIGLIVGILQCLLLILVLPNANRRILAMWIPASILGWAIGSIIGTFVTASSGMSFLVSVVSGLTIGILQWLILRKFSKVALWWIPARIIDWVAFPLLAKSYVLDNVSDINLIKFLFGVAGSIASSIAIVFILNKTLSVSKGETENIAESGGV